MLAILIQTIAHQAQRYPTCGDWEFSVDAQLRSLDVRVSEMGNPVYEFLVGLHETVEAMLCRQAGITQESIDEFDFAWEAVSPEHRGPYDEPGDHPEAPYHKQHVQAGIIERQIALALGVNWDEYEAALDKLYKQGEGECRE